MFSPPKSMKQSDPKSYQLPDDELQPLAGLNSDSKVRQSLDQTLQIKGWQIHEKELEHKLYSYLETLSVEMKHSFAPLSILIDSMSDGYDPHYLSVCKGNQMKGLIAFNVDTMV